MGHEQDPQPNITPGKYKHSKKGGLYEVIGVARHSETLEWMVVYRALYENSLAEIWVRPASMWNEEVEVEGKRISRFVRID